MRIMLLSQFYPPIIGGEERHVRNLGAALARRGHEVIVATLWYPGACQSERDGDVQVHRIRGTLQRAAALFSESERRHAPPFPDPELAAGLMRILRQEKPDVVHAHNWLLHSFLPLRRWSRAPLVVTLHDYSLVCARKTLMQASEPCSGPAFAKCLACASQHYGRTVGSVTTIGNWLSASLERRAVDKFIAVSGSVARLNRLQADGLPFEIIPNFVPDSVGTPSPVIDPCVRQLPQDGYMLFVGDLRALKGVNVVLEAYAKLDGAPPLVLIGRECPDTPKKLPPGVHLFKSWPHSAVTHAWKRCLFGLAPSVWPEPCATVVMEAMGFGKPVIATDIGGMPDMVRHGETGLLVPPGDADALAGAMKALIADPALRQRLSAASLRRVGELKVGVIATRIEAVYQEVIAHGTSACRPQADALHV
jgi:glycosyltransferase involved in cell wall biosynthesis